MKRKRRKQYPVWLSVIATLAAILVYLFTETTLLDPLLNRLLPQQNVAPQSADTTAVDVSPAAAPCLSPDMEFPRLLEDRPGQLIRHLAYTVHYNPKWRVPNWVAYCLTAEETQGGEERASHFYPDPMVEGDPVVTKDYSNSGYDRGHMAPAADFKWSEEAMRESFYMTNMCPQNHNLNAGDWKELEELVRQLAVQYGRIYVACGPVVAARPKTIGTERKIAVPQAFFKALLRQRNDGSWTAVGFLFANKAGNKPLSAYATTIDELQTTTGIDFFPALPDEAEQQAEVSCTLSDWNL